MELLVSASSGAIAGLIAGVIGSLVAPWVQWTIEKRRNRQSYRRELIQRWRKIIAAQIGEETDIWDVEGFSHTAEYSTMKPHLSSASREWIEVSVAERRALVKEAGIGPWGNQVMEYRRRLLDELARLEQEWGLV